MGGLLARDLMVALVRAGVTATCSSADKPRYGDLAVDSNLPDARIALGGPSRTPSPRRYWPPPIRPTPTRSSVSSPTADGPGVGAGRRRRWPTAGCPAPTCAMSRALPVLVVAGRDDAELEAAIAAVADDLADAEIVVSQQAPSGLQPFEPRTVALLNRGVPGFAVETDGTLHTSLMRSCTGWPSGIWIDEPRRTAPDGSNFQLQHWTHAFDYALVAGDGDWRHAEIPARSAEFSQPLLAVDGVRPGWRAARRRFTAAKSTRPARCSLGALKAAGNPLARGSAQPVDPGRVAIRLVETRGGAHRRRGALAAGHDVGAANGGSAGAAAAVGATSPSCTATRSPPRWRASTCPGCSTARPPRWPRTPRAAQPLYARYWLHNRGPAPLGGLPAVAHLHPHRLTAAAGDDVVLRLTAASDCSDAPLVGTVAAGVPARLVGQPGRAAVHAAARRIPGGRVDVTMPAEVVPGWYPVRAQLAGHRRATSRPPGGRPSKTSAWWRSVGPTTADWCDSSRARRRRGGRGRLGAPGRHRAAPTHAPTSSLEAHLISPWGTWEWLGPATLGAELPARGTVELDFDVAPPAWVEPGEWWALVRVACAGRLVYTPAVRVTVR